MIGVTKIRNNPLLDWCKFEPLNDHSKLVPNVNVQTIWMLRAPGAFQNYHVTTLLESGCG